MDINECEKIVNELKSIKEEIIKQSKETHDKLDELADSYKYPSNGHIVSEDEDIGEYDVNNYVREKAINWMKDRAKEKIIERGWEFIGYTVYNLNDKLSPSDIEFISHKHIINGIYNLYAIAKDKNGRLHYIFIFSF